MALMNDVNNGRDSSSWQRQCIYVSVDTTMLSIDDVNSNYYIFTVSMQQCRCRILTLD